jgi:uncharacterized protein YdeI (YjbR/CyaY-like superfamily)
MTTPLYFQSAAAFRAWLDEHHASESELVVGFYKKGATKKGLTYKEAVDEALCFGWIDGVLRRVDDERFMQRFSPRKPKSTWSAINIARVEELTKLGRMTKAGLAAFARRDEKRSRIYAYENRDRTLDPAYETRFRAKKKAWAFFEAQPPWYRRTSAYWVMNAKKEETRDRRFETLVADSQAGRRIKHLISPTGKPATKQ